MNNSKEYNKNMDIIVNYALRHKAIIHGKYVKDKIVMEYNKGLYFKNDVNKKKLCDEYANLDFFPETNDRNIILDNIDLCFNSMKNIDLFVDDICEKFDVVLCKKINQINYCKNIEVYKFRILHSINSSPIIKLRYDINTCWSSSMEPPFGNINLLTNSIIIKYEPNNYMFSKNTGLRFDQAKHDHFMKVLKLIRSKKDYVVDTVDGEQSAMSLIMNIVDTTLNGVNILNIDWITFGKYIDNPCIICLENSSDICLMKTSYFHHKCFCDYVRSIKIDNDGVEYYFMSPYREKCILKFSPIY